MKRIGGMLSPGGARGRLTILIYHRVATERDSLGFHGVLREHFAWQLELLASACNVLHLSDAVQALRDGTLPSRAVCVTFDDGYADNVEVALPELLRNGVPATFFISTGYLDGGLMFNDTVIEAVRGCRAARLDLRDIGLGAFSLGSDDAKRRALGSLLEQVKYLEPQVRHASVAAIADRCGGALPRDLMMTSAQVRELVAAGMEVGGHTVTHPILTRVDDETALGEIQTGRSRLRDITQAPVRVFAYPNGKPGHDYGPVHAKMAQQAGFEAAVSTSWGSACVGSPLFELPRFSPWDRTPERFAARLASNWRREQTDFATARREPEAR